MWISVKETGFEQLGEEAFDADGDQPVDRFFRTCRQFFSIDPLRHKNFPGINGRESTVNTMLDGSIYSG
jgi:hypothetical protein